MKIKLIQTCSACPEQYDAYLNGTVVGYLRLRHGYFRAEYFGTEVYSASPKGDGFFDNDDERVRHLNAACKAILDAHTNAIVAPTAEEPVYDLEIL